jgi:hypothetical protein
MFDAHKVIPHDYLRAGHCVLAWEYLTAAGRIIQPGRCPYACFILSPSGDNSRCARLQPGVQLLLLS